MSVECLSPVLDSYVCTEPTNMDSVDCSGCGTRGDFEQQTVIIEPSKHLVVSLTRMAFSQQHLRTVCTSEVLVGWLFVFLSLPPPLPVISRLVLWPACHRGGSLLCLSGEGHVQCHHRASAAHS